jgi:hypothetical protein
MNLQALAAMDDCEHATGKTLAQHIKETPREIIGNEAYDRLRAAGYQVVQVVQTGNKTYPTYTVKAITPPMTGWS